MKMEPTLRTFCVIPHNARDNEYFDAVFENGVRVLYQGRLHTLFSRVLSPAHDIVAYITGPLLARVREGGNAALIIALPEDVEGVDGGDERDSGRKKYGENAGSSAASGDTASCGEWMDVAMELYSHLLPLLFRSAERCSFARVSVVAFAANGKKVYDVLQRCEVRSARCAQYLLIEREGSSARWGEIMQLLLHERHTQLEQDGALPPESVLAVRVELEGYGTVVVAEVGSEKGTLHHLTMLLRSGGACGAKTCPPRGPLFSILRDVTPPAGLVHIVGIPDPGLAPRSTMRLLRFMSGMCDTSEASSSRQHLEEEKVLDEHISLPYPDTRLEGTNTTATTKQQQQVTHPYAWGQELFVDPSLCVGRVLGRQFPTSTTSNWDWGASRPEHPRHNASAACTTAGVAPFTTAANNNNNNTIKMGSPPAVVPPEDVTAAHTSREQALVNRSAALDHANRELSAALSAARAEIRHMQGLHHSSQDALRQKHDALLAVTASNQKATKENKDYSGLVPKLLRKIKVLETKQITLQQTVKERESQFDDMQYANKRLQEQLHKLQNEMKIMTKKETQRLREQALNRIAAEGESEKNIVEKAKKTAFLTRTRGAPNSRPVKADRLSKISKTEDAKDNSKLVDMIEELQRRNALLESDLRVFRRGASAAAVESSGRNGLFNVQDVCVGNTDAGAEKNVHCTTCATLRRELQRLSVEAESSREERMELHRLLADRPVPSLPSPSIVRDAAEVVAGSLIGGCESLCTQLEHIEAEAQRHVQRGGKESRLPTHLFREHMDAISALEVALQDIRSRRYRGMGNYERIVPLNATAADAEHLSSLLSFEMERCTHLRAFVPTFAQLAVATEHMKMRVFSPDI